MRILKENLFHVTSTFHMVALGAYLFLSYLYYRIFNDVNGLIFLAGYMTLVLFLINFNAIFSTHGFKIIKRQWTYVLLSILLIVSLIDITDFIISGKVVYAPFSITGSLICYIIYLYANCPYSDLAKEDGISLKLDHRLVEYNKLVFNSLDQMFNQYWDPALERILRANTIRKAYLNGKLSTITDHALKQFSSEIKYNNDLDTEISAEIDRKFLIEKKVRDTISK